MDAKASECSYPKGCHVELCWGDGRRKDIPHQLSLVGLDGTFLQRIFLPPQAHIFQAYCDTSSIDGLYMIGTVMVPLVSPLRFPLIHMVCYFNKNM
jgi:hypothetical protein